MEIEIAVANVVLWKFYFSNLEGSKKRPVSVLKDNLSYDVFFRHSN